NAKVLEKQIAEIELKMSGVAEREKILQRQGLAGSPSGAADQLRALDEQRSMLVKQLAQANAAAERSRSLREERGAGGEELATETHLTAMKENLASIHSNFGANDPSSVIDEMRSRINRSGAVSSPGADLAAEADRELAREAKRTSVEDMLSQYKQSIANPELETTVPTTPDSATQNQPAANQTANPSQPSDASGNTGPSEGKTLGRVDGPIRPID
ncbi:MAG TPA: hypothetical protein VI756_30490, partial [Blastocatellia bacterium]